MTVQYEKPTTPCIERGAGIPRGEYRTIHFKHKNGKMTSTPAHKWAWEKIHGPVPKGLFVCHKCDNPRCENLEHLFLGTPLQNMQDKMAKNRHRTLRPGNPMPDIFKQPDETPLSPWEEAKRNTITEMLRSKNGNISQTARALGLSLNCTKRYLRKFGLIQPGK